MPICLAAVAVHLRDSLAFLESEGLTWLVVVWEHAHEVGTEDSNERYDREAIQGFQVHYACNVAAGCLGHPL